MDQSISTEDQLVKATPRLTLLDLPNELLHQIFDEAYKLRTRLARNPICRALLPFQHKALFRSPALFDFTTFAGLVKRIDDQPSLAPLIKRVTLNFFPRGRRERWAEQGRPVPGDEGFPNDEEVTGFLRALRSVEYISVSGSNRTCRLLLNPTFVSDRTFLPKLARLSLQGEVVGSAQDLLPRTDITLHHQPPLTSLTLRDVDLFLNPANLFAPPPEGSHLPILSFRARNDQPQAVRLFGSLSTLTTLHLYGNHLLFDALLLALPSPDTLLELSVTSFDGEQLWTPNHLRRLASLQRLLLNSGCDCTSPAFFDGLRFLPLEHLSLEDVNDISASECLELVSGPRRHRSLKTLTIDGPLNWPPASVLDRPLPCFYDKERSVCTLQSGWRLPEWTDTFTREDCRALLEAAARCGQVEIKGEVTEALQTEEAYEVEVLMLPQMCKAYMRWQRRKIGSPAWMKEVEAWLRVVSRR